MGLIDEVAAELAARQAGAFARWQLRAEGLDGRTVDRRAATGTWGTAHPGVFLHPATPATWLRSMWAAWLAAGPSSFVAFESAAQVHSVPAVVRGGLVLTNKHGAHHRLAGVVVHQIDDVLPHHVVRVEGLPVTTVARTIVDLAAVVAPTRLDRILEDAKHARLVTYDEVWQCLYDVARRRKPGVKALTVALTRLTETQPKTDSHLEACLLRVIRQAGLPAPVQQYALPGRQAVVGCVDVAIVEAKLLLEADGRPWHTRIRDLKRDSDRVAEAARAGWQTLRLLEEHITGDPEGTAALLKDVVAERLRLLRGTRGDDRHR